MASTLSSLFLVTFLNLLGVRMSVGDVVWLVLYLVTYLFRMSVGVSTGDVVWLVLYLVTSV